VMHQGDNGQLAITINQDGGTSKVPGVSCHCDLPVWL
jgi:hypothetical protein